MLVSSGRLVNHTIQHPKQNGWECHLYAISCALALLHENYKLVQNPLPARKRDVPQSISCLAMFWMMLFTNNKSLESKLDEEDSKNYQWKSLWEYTKQNLHSAVGEIYNQEDIIKLITETHPEVSVTKVNCINDEKKYCEILIGAIEKKASPIVFFNVNDNNGQPMPGKEALHFAVVVDYKKYDNGRITFKIFQWGREFSVDAHALFESTSQLENISHYDTYKKIYTHNGEGAWLPEKIYNPKRQRAASTCKAKSPIQKKDIIKSSILILDANNREIVLFLNKINIKINKLSNSFFSSRRSKGMALSALRNEIKQNFRTRSVTEIIEDWKTKSNGETNYWTLVKKPWFFAKVKTESQSIIEDYLEIKHHVGEKSPLLQESKSEYLLDEKDSEQKSDGDTRFSETTKYNKT